MPLVKNGTVKYVLPSPTVTNGPANVVPPSPRVNDGTVEDVPPSPTVKNGPTNVVPTLPQVNDGTVEDVPPSSTIKHGPTNVVPPSARVKDGAVENVRKKPKLVDVAPTTLTEERAHFVTNAILTNYGTSQGLAPNPYSLPSRSNVNGRRKKKKSRCTIPNTTSDTNNARPNANKVAEIPEKIHVCPKCNFTTPNGRDYRNHMENVIVCKKNR